MGPTLHACDHGVEGAFEKRRDLRLAHDAFGRGLATRGCGHCWVAVEGPNLNYRTVVYIFRVNHLVSELW